MFGGSGGGDERGGGRFDRIEIKQRITTISTTTTTIKEPIIFPIWYATESAA
jgi:hypothetical protein